MLTTTFVQHRQGRAERDRAGRHRVGHLVLVSDGPGSACIRVGGDPLKHHLGHPKQHRSCTWYRLNDEQPKVPSSVMLVAGHIVCQSQDLKWGSATQSASQARYVQQACPDKGNVGGKQCCAYTSSLSTDTNTVPTHHQAFVHTICSCTRVQAGHRPKGVLGQGRI